MTFPFLLYQLYAYLIPAFSQDVSKRLRPMLMFVPLLFLAGAAFGYYVVVPSAVQFLYFWASDEVNRVPRARSLYPFEMTMMFVMGIIFEMPAAVWVLTRVARPVVADDAEEPAHRDRRSSRVDAPQRCRAPTRSRCCSSSCRCSSSSRSRSGWRAASSAP